MPTHPHCAADHRRSTPQRSQSPIRASRRTRTPQRGTQSRTPGPRSRQTSTRCERTPTHQRRALGKATLRLQLDLPRSPNQQSSRRPPHRPMGTTLHPVRRNQLHMGPVRAQQQARTRAYPRTGRLVHCAHKVRAMRNATSRFPAPLRSIREIRCANILAIRRKRHNPHQRKGNDNHN